MIINKKSKKNIIIRSWFSVFKTIFEMHVRETNHNIFVQQFILFIFIKKYIVII